MTSPSFPSSLWVVCLCADWCGLCRDYQAVFAALAARYPQHRFAWLDIEDQADLVGDMDVETFPTLLLADAQGPRFFGPLTPQAQTLARLLDTQASAQPVPPLRGLDVPCVTLLLQRLAAQPAHRVAG